MKRIVTILVFCLLSFSAAVFNPLFAQLVQPVKWSGEEVGDSVRLRAVVEPGWHMSILEMGEFMFTQEFKDSFSMTVAKTDLAPIRFNACNDVMCTAPEIWEYESVSPKDDLSAERSVSESGLSGVADLLRIFLLGLLGGLLAIFTPCVWPIIPMTVSFFLKKGGGLKDAVLYGLSIVILYVGLGLLVTILFGASALNDLSTNAVVNIVFFLILVIFALSFFGLFEITLPDSWSTALDNKARSTGGFLSILLMAFTLVIVSFSCTGPIIGTLLVEAAGHSLIAPTMGMLGFAIALALPFSLFAMFPEWLKQAPKSGDWMTSFKVVLAFLKHPGRNGMGTLDLPGQGAVLLGIGERKARPGLCFQHGQRLLYHMKYAVRHTAGQIVAHAKLLHLRGHGKPVKALAALQIVRRQRAVFCHIAALGLLGQLQKVFQQGEGLAVLRVGVQIKLQLMGGKAQAHDLSHGRAAQILHVDHVHKGQIQAGKQRSALQAVRRVVLRHAALLHRHIGPSKRRALRQDPASVITASVAVCLQVDSSR